MIKQVLKPCETFPTPTEELKDYKTPLLTPGRELTIATQKRLKDYNANRVHEYKTQLS
jgi:hypothetical protein